DRGTRDAVGRQPGLPVEAAAGDRDHRVETPAGVGDGERLERLLGGAIAREVLVERLPVDHHRALTGNESHPRDRGLPASGALEIGSRFHAWSSLAMLWGFCA